jgi:hypothetical protein
MKVALASMAGDFGVPRGGQMIAHVDQGHIETAILWAAKPEYAMGDANITLPVHFEEYQKFVEQVMYHGGCPREPQSGLVRDVLKGLGWIPLISMVQARTGIMFWNKKNYWMWEESGVGVDHPRLDPRRLLEEYREPADHRSSSALSAPSVISRCAGGESEEGEEGEMSSIMSQETGTATTHRSARQRRAH